MSSPEWGDDPVALRGAQRVFTAQLAICVVAGASSMLLFCIFRSRWPHMYALRTLREGANVKPLPAGWFTWILAVYRYSDEELLRVSGLDAYVFVAFFKMAIRIFATISVLAIAVMSPARYWAHRDDGVDWVASSLPQWRFGPVAPLPLVDGSWFFYLYALATYVFSAIVYRFLYDYTLQILKVRQKYLASQNSITDRTILLSGIPTKLLVQNNPKVLARFVESMGIGTVTDVRFVYDWTPLNRLFALRTRLLRQLESLYAGQNGLEVNLYNERTPAVTVKDASNLVQSQVIEQCAELRTQLLVCHHQIRQIQQSFNFSDGTMSDPRFPQMNAAFITMDSVASAQMAAQTVLDPRVHKLIVTLAPAPKDIKWESFVLTPRAKLAKAYVITFVIFLSFLVLFFPISSISTLLNVKAITKFWPALGKRIAESKWLSLAITGILPPFLFSLFNFSLPYFYQWLTLYQGYPSNSDIELSTLSKNFFYIFFNLFLVFTVTGTVSNLFGLIGDTTKIAYQLATSLQELSLFYINLILLQGVAMFPIRLLQIPDFLMLNLVGRVFFLSKYLLKTPRDYRAYYYTPPVFDFGLQLPQHILIFIIVLIYSVVSTKIITCGLVYFVLGHLVYKYQLIYNFVHPPHSTGKVWPMIFRRLILGLIIFQIFMCGTLALNDAYVLSVACVPLLLVSLVILWNFESYYLPLHKFIALRAIQNPSDAYDKEFGDEDEQSVNTRRRNQHLEMDEHLAAASEASPLLFEDTDFLSTSDSRTLHRRRSTIDEEREESANYTYPYLTDPLNGPWVGFEGNYVSMFQYSQESTDDPEAGDISVLSQNDHERIIRKRLTVSEWE
ncbi:Calcium permeable stress-gated cation channel 1 [[Candida] zeylanoides]